MTPRVVVHAVRLMLLRSAVSAVAVIVEFVTWDDLRDRYLDKQPHASNSSVTAALTTAAVFSIALLIFYVFLALRVYRGANWARIVTWVIAGLGILGAALSLGQPDPPLSRTLGVLVGLIDIAVVLLLAAPDSNRYFRPVPLR